MINDHFGISSMGKSVFLPNFQNIARPVVWIANTQDMAVLVIWALCMPSIIDD
jgi:hypothetical protein